MNHIEYSSKYGWGICVLLLVFIFSPVLSTQPDAHPGALYVVPIIVSIFIMALLSGIIRPRIINLYAVLFLFFAIISTAISNIVGFGSGLLKLFVFIILFISISSFVLTPKQLKISFKTYLYLSIAISILIILSFVFGYPHIEEFGFQGRYSIGITGIFKNPNYLSSFYNASFFVICYILATVTVPLKEKVVFYSILALFVVATFFTGTRAALLVEAFVVIAMMFIKAKRTKMYKFIPVVIIIFIVLIYYWSTLIELYNMFVAGREMMSDSIREVSWNYALHFIKENPILGCGHKAWDVIRFTRGDVDEYLHNIFLELILDQGIIGLLLVIAIIFIGYNRTKKGDRLFLMLLLVTTGFPLLFQNGLYEVNFWRFLIINRLMINVSVAYDGGIKGFLESMYGRHSSKSKQYIF